MRYLLFLPLCAFLVDANVVSAQEKKDFNAYILKSVAAIAGSRANGGYDITKSFTRNLSYGNGVIKATEPPKTMCVAAIEEIIVEAINLYAKDNGAAVFDKIPLSSWSKGTLTGLKANIFMYKGTGSRGTAYTLERFGMGQQRTFEKLKPGDFVNLNRTSGSGHAVVFMGYLNKTADILPTYSSDAVGFKYFSAQGKGKPDAGFGYRYGFFDGFCPTLSNKLRDCKIIRSPNVVLLNVGRMFDPSEWDYDGAVAKIKAGVRSGFEAAYPGQTRGFIDTLTNLELNRELEPVTEIDNYFNGETTD